MKKLIHFVPGLYAVCNTFQPGPHQPTPADRATQDPDAATCTRCKKRIGRAKEFAWDWKSWAGSARHAGNLACWRLCLVNAARDYVTVIARWEGYLKSKKDELAEIQAALAANPPLAPPKMIQEGT